MNLWPLDFRRPAPAPRPDPVAVEYVAAKAALAAVNPKDTRGLHYATTRLQRAMKALFEAAPRQDIARQAVGGGR